MQRGDHMRLLLVEQLRVQGQRHVRLRERFSVRQIAERRSATGVGAGEVRGYRVVDERADPGLDSCACTLVAVVDLNDKDMPCRGTLVELHGKGQPQEIRQRVEVQRRRRAAPSVPPVEVA